MATLAISIGAITYWIIAEPGSADPCNDVQWHQALDCGRRIMDTLTN
jgi:hypothetical protein